jgi:hypothetical protein
MEKSVIVSIILLVIIALGIVLLPKTQDINPIVGLAITEQKSFSIAPYDTITMNLGGTNYYLYLSSISWSRDGADFILKSDLNASPYIQNYFRLNFDRVRTTMYKNPEIIYTQPQRTKTINVGKEKNIYIELVSIESRKANVIVKWV